MKRRVETEACLVHYAKAEAETQALLACEAKMLVEKQRDEAWTAEK